MKDFYSRLSYGLGNEDWKTESLALQLNEDSEILCVTASGDRPLNLLTSPCKRLVAIDINPIQTALLDLKVAAMRVLDYEEYLAFLGITPSDCRLQQYAKLRGELKLTSRKIWDKELKKIKKGIIYQGWLEKTCKNISRILYMISGRKIDKLFSFKTIEEQKAYVEEKFCTSFWRKALLTLYRPSLLKFFIRDPGLYAHVDPSIHSGTYLISKIENSLKTHRVHENIVLSLMLKGKMQEEAFPPYLSRKGFEKIRKNLDVLEFQTINLLDYLKQAPEGSINRFSVSDVASYMPHDQYRQMLEDMKRIAQPGARFCIRQFQSRYQIPEELDQHFSREEQLEKRLEEEDRCFIYTFLVGTLENIEACENDSLLEETIENELAEVSC